MIPVVTLVVKVQCSFSLRKKGVSEAPPSGATWPLAALLDSTEAGLCPLTTLVPTPSAPPNGITTNHDFLLHL